MQIYNTCMKVSMQLSTLMLTDPLKAESTESTG